LRRLTYRSPKPANSADIPTLLVVDNAELIKMCNDYIRAIAIFLVIIYN